MFPQEIEAFRQPFEAAVRERFEALGGKINGVVLEAVLRRMEEITVEKSRSLPKPALIILAAATAVGKTTVGQKLEAMGIKRFPRYTTRAKREGEVDGKDYWFVSLEDLQAKRDRGELLQYSETYGEGRAMDRNLFWDWVNSGQVFYIDGSTRTPVDFRNHEDEAVREVSLLTVELLPPSFDEWMRRMMESRELEEALKRLPTAMEQIKQGGETVDLVIINDDVERVVRVLSRVTEKE